MRRKGLRGSGWLPSPRRVPPAQALRHFALGVLKGLALLAILGLAGGASIATDAPAAGAAPALATPGIDRGTCSPLGFTIAGVTDFKVPTGARVLRLENRLGVSNVVLIDARRLRLSAYGSARVRLRHHAQSLTVSALHSGTALQACWP